MGLVKPDFSEVSGSLQPGVYTARITAGDLQQSKKSVERGETGPDMVQWTYEIFGADAKGTNGQTVKDRTMINGKGAFRLQDLYRAAMKQELSGEFDTDMLLGKEVKITLAQGVQQDGSPSKYPEVKSVTGI